MFLVALGTKGRAVVVLSFSASKFSCTCIGPPITQDTIESNLNNNSNDSNNNHNNNNNNQK